MSGLNGVLAVDKPVGPTSHDVVARSRRALREKRIGHTGTLDPFASGLLLLCVGPATRLAEYLTALPKTYQATLRLGVTTDSDDLTGSVLVENDAWSELSEESVRDALRAQIGQLDQLPPMYSAKKVDGERMYAAARRGETIERETSAVVVHSLTVDRYDPPFVDFTVDCSSGTYIRAIARDVGEALGVGAHLSALRRTRVGEFRVEDALTLEALESGDQTPTLLAPASAVAHLPSLQVDEQGVRALGFGAAVPAAEGIPAGEPIAILDPAGDLIAIGERKGDDVRPRKVFT